MNDPLFSFIFVNFQSGRAVGQSLTTLAKTLSGIPAECIVVNNDISESQVLSELHAKFPFELIELGANYGFGRANNEGAKRARGKYLVFLNPDTIFLQGNWRSLEAFFGLHPEAVVGLALFTPEGQREAWAYGSTPTLFSLLTSKLRGWQEERKGRRVFSVAWVSGAALALPKALFEKTRGFDESFFLYYEDVDLCLRARQAGAQVFWYPFIQFSHSRGQSHTEYASMKKAYFEGQRHYFAKHRSKIENLLLFFVQPLYRRFFS